MTAQLTALRVERILCFYLEVGCARGAFTPTVKLNSTRVKQRTPRADVHILNAVDRPPPVAKSCAVNCTSRSERRCALLPGCAHTVSVHYRFTAPNGTTAHQVASRGSLYI